MASIESLMYSAGRSIHDADALSNVTSDDLESITSLIAAVTGLREIIKQQEERNQKIAAALDELAEAIHYPTSSVRELRAKVREVARIARGEQSQEGR